jgi:hypothetical protein
MVASFCVDRKENKNKQNKSERNVNTQRSSTSRCSVIRLVCTSLSAIVSDHYFSSGQVLVSSLNQEGVDIMLSNKLK